MSDKKTVERFRVEIVALDTACANIIDRETEDANLHDARRLIVSALMRACGVSRLLAAALIEREVSLAECVDVRKRVHEAIGALGDWCGDLCLALRRLYAMDLAPSPGDGRSVVSEVTCEGELDAQAYLVEAMGDIDYWSRQKPSIFKTARTRNVKRVIELCLEIKRLREEAYRQEGGEA